MTDVARRPGDPDGAPRPPKPKKQEQEPASEEITEVAPGVIRMQLPIWMPGLGHVNMYGLLDDRGLAVVDPGLPGPAVVEGAEDAAEDRRLQARDIHTVIVTHSHPDHFGGAGRIKQGGGRASSSRTSAFTTWSLDRKTRSSRHALAEREAERLEQDAAAAAEALDVVAEELPTRSATTTATATPATRCSTTRPSSASASRCRGAARRRGAAASTRCRRSSAG